MAERRITPMTRNFLLVLAIIPNIIPLALAGVMFQPPARNLTGTGLNFCTDRKEWYGSATEEDCKGAVQRLYDLEVKSRMKDPMADPMDDFEFHTPAVKPSGIPPMKTPRRYTVGTCTIAVVMLNTIWNKIGDQSLPGGVVEGPFASRDVTSYQEIWEAACEIESRCLEDARKPGWAAEGGREAIGVFMWGTDSFINKRVPPGPQVGLPQSPSFTISPNNSTTSYTSPDVAATA